MCFAKDKVLRDGQGRYVMVVGSIGGTAITILNLYVPNDDNPVI